MSLKYLLFCLLLLVSAAAVAQVRLEGVVRDSLNEPLESANVIAIDKATSALEAYGITDSEGRFSLDLGKNGTFEIQISYVGFEDKTIQLSEDGIVEIILNEGFELDAVEISMFIAVGNK